MHMHLSTTINALSFGDMYPACVHMASLPRCTQLRGGHTQLAERSSTRIGCQRTMVTTLRLCDLTSVTATQADGTGDRMGPLAELSSTRSEGCCCRHREALIRGLLWAREGNA